MLIRMRTTYAGPAGTCAAGAEISLPDDVANPLIESGNAEKVPPQPNEEPKREPKAEAETAEAPAAPERADAPPPRRRLTKKRE